MSADPALDALVEAILKGAPDAGALETLGEAEPGRAAASLSAAVAHPGLAATAGEWLPPLLVTARPAAGAAALVALSDALAAAGERLPERWAAVARVLGSSPFLARLLQRTPSWVRELDSDPVPAPDVSRVDADWSAIRRAKYRGLLRIAARDLAGRPFEGSLAELSALADACLCAALRCVETERGGKSPALFALGKLEGRELNFSSDVDLLFLEAAGSEGDVLEQHRRNADFIRSFKSGLEARTDEGFAYRVDLDLRPEGRSGELVNSLEAALNYYETFGAEWERQMLIRLRALSGPPDVTEAFPRELAPFVYRRHLDPATLDSVRAMKARIEHERSRDGVDLEADLKEGPGGIRDVEFLVQALQLLLGGQQQTLRTGNVLAALGALGEIGALSAAVVEHLRSAYLWLRRAEHSVQLEEERQTHRFPRDARAQLELARRMGYSELDARAARDRLLDDWTNVRAEVRGHFEALVLRGDAPVAGSE